jgi:squalene-hopene/tetraprenyl-beta-curcumene cyclase
MRRSHRIALAAAVGLAGSSMLIPVARAFETAVKQAPAASTATSPQSQQAQALIDKGLAYLKTQQKPDGSWQAEKDPPAVSAIVLKAFVQDGKYDANTDFVKRGYDKLLTYQLEDGGIYKDLLANYNTSIAVSALAAADNPEFKDRIDRAVAYLKGLQWTPETRPEYAGNPKEQFAGKQLVKDDTDPFFGGTGYGGGRSTGNGRPDLSNTQLTLEALRDAGLKADDPAFQNAVKFVTRVQNLSETNDRPWAGDDGGFVYGPAENRMGESMAGEYTSPDGKRLLRSYGSMTYAGLKSMIYAGLTKDDPRVKAAFAWVSKNWTLDENPGMRLNNPQAAQFGLYYYFHTLARALNAYDQPTITDAQGTQHDWRVELVNKLASLQKPDGSFAGEKRFMEDNPVLVTSYVAIALQETLEDLKQHPPK